MAILSKVLQTQNSCPQYLCSMLFQQMTEAYLKVEGACNPNKLSKAKYDAVQKTLEFAVKFFSETLNQSELKILRHNIVWTKIRFNLIYHDLEKTDLPIDKERYKRVEDAAEKTLKAINQKILE